MKKLNKSRYAILGMLFNKKLSGYQIIQHMQESTANFWQETDASIYPMLKKLEAEGKVTAERAYRGKRAKKIYGITPEGKKEFVEWMGASITPGTHRNELLLKIFFGANVDKKVIIEHLQLRQKKMLEMRKNFAYIQMFVFPEIPNDDPHKVFWKMTLANGIFRTEAELKWIEECLIVLNTKEKND